jgi:cyanophycinase
MTPKGKLIAIGGNEDKGTYPHPKSNRNYRLNFFELGILKRITTELHDIDARIEVITSASMIPEEVGELYIRAFSILGSKNVGLMHIRHEKEVHEQAYIKRITEADGVMFTGGNQSRLTRFFGQSEILDIMKHRYLHENFIIAGTSAGAMAMSEIMITGGSSSAALLKGAVKIGKGLGMIQNVIIDSHFVKRGRFGRLAEAIASHPKTVGIGLGEDTGVLIKNGNIIETIGSNLVIIMDGHTIKHSNIFEAEEGTPLSIENIQMHVLAKGNVYDIRERQFFKDQETHDLTLADIRNANR